METRIAGLLNCIAIYAITGMWYVYLFVAQPETMGTFEAAKETAYFALTEPGYVFFYSTLASLVVCLVCGILLLLNKYSVQVMYIIIIHTVFALFTYDITLSISIGLPLLCFGKVKANA